MQFSQRVLSACVELGKFAIVSESHPYSRA